MGGEEVRKTPLGKGNQERSSSAMKGPVKILADFFAQIVDYKSEFTGMHSIGVAKKRQHWQNTSVMTG